MTDCIFDHVPQGCLEPEQIAAYLDGCLTDAEPALVERHVTICPACAELLLASAQALMPQGDPRLERLEALCRNQTP